MIGAVTIPVLQRQLEGIAEEMGAMLVRSALSSNIKERRDSSTALFDARGTLLAQAAHIPVHLGSMGHSVDAVCAQGPRPGEVWMLNDPYAGGTHLPDITLVAVVATPDGPLGYAAVRAHHADVGGRVPGSMAIEAASVDEEGVRIPPTVVGTLERLDESAIARFTSCMRQPAERAGDLRAQAAALRVAQRRLPALAQAWGGDARFRAVCDELVRHGEQRCRAALAAHDDGSGTAERAIELPVGSAGHAVVRAEARLERDELTVDLRLSSDQLAGTSLNCPAAVTHAAVMFAVRSVFDPDLPTSGGVDVPVRVLTRAGSIVDARHPAPVAGGNVEVSSVVVDVVSDALARIANVPAAGQGTMNNLVLGNERFSYYETIAGGQGATSSADGPSGVHVAMTNTRNTPVEALEHDFPVEVLRYELRPRSGGEGRRRGGDGVVRELRVLEACQLTFVSQRRLSGPAGRAGGFPGSAGAQFVNDVAVPGCVQMPLRAGDVVRIETPGGGGYGTPPRE